MQGPELLKRLDASSTLGPERFTTKEFIIAMNRLCLTCLCFRSGSHNMCCDVEVPWWSC